MAQDIFAPKSSFNIGYERPVAQPVEDKRGETQAKFRQMANEMEASQIRAQTQVEKAKAGIATSLFGGVSKATTGYMQQQAKERSSGVANSWLEEMQKAQDKRDQGNATEAALIERKATKQAVSSGLDLDKYKTEYEAVTGRPMEYVGQTREQQAFEMMKNDQSFQAAYLAAQGKLGEGASDDELMSAALSSVRQQAIATDTLALVGAGNKLNWETQLKGAYSTVLDQFDDSIVAGLVMRTQQGQPITPGEIDTVLMQHNLMSQKLIKPAYVSDEQWNEVKQRMTLQKEFLTSLKGARDPDNMLTDLVSQMMQSAETPLDAMAVAAASDPSNLAATLGLNIPEVMNTLAGSAFTDNNWKKRGQIITDLQAADVTTPVNGNTTFTIETVPPVLQKYLNADKATMKKNVDAGIVALSSIKPMELQTEESRKQLYNGVMSVAAGMLSDKQFYSSSVVSKVFNNPNLKQSLDMVAAVDLESANEMRNVIRTAATLQSKAVQENLSSIESTMEFGGYNAGLQWDEQEGRYYITDPQAINHGVQTLGSGGVSDKGLYIDPKLPIAPRGLEDAYDRRKSMVVLDRAINQLAVEGSDDATVPETITYDLPSEVLNDAEFLSEVDRVATDFNIDPNLMLAVMDFETIGSFSPSEKSGASSATGLIQFLSSTAEGLGTSTEALAGMSRAEQMKYVEKYLEPYKGRIKNLGDLYMAVHWPAGVGKSDDYVMYRKGSNNYKANSGLDVNKNGTVTRAEALQRLRSVTGRKFAITQTELEPAGAMPTDELTSMADQAIQETSLRPQARPEIPNVVDQDFFNDTVKTKLEGAGLNPSNTLYFATQDEAEQALQQGRIKSGDKVVIGTSVVEVE